jgi:hypothetical protein
MSTKRIAILTLAFAALCLVTPSQAVGSGIDTRGYIYGTVETESGTEYTGLMRWGTEEAFWDDLFHASKKDLPQMEERPDDERRRRITILGITVGYRYDDSRGGRLLVARYGDIQEIRVKGSDSADLVMKNGNIVRVDGGSNDVGGEITVFDDSLGAVELSWKRIERITFKETPRSIEPPGYRLYGKLTTEDDETFEGFIQWDVQECLSIDKLDGETRDGDLSIAMGQIRKITKHSSSASLVELKDGREFVLRGTNDVNDDNRGIMVQDERFGRVSVGWAAFESLEFVETGKSGKGYGEYKPGRALKGSVTDQSGKKHSGTLVFDLDEAETWELLHGLHDDIEYIIPFEKVRSVRPDRWKSAIVELKGGVELKLSEHQDVSDKNAGVVILMGADSKEYVAWKDVKRVDFE